MGLLAKLGLSLDHAREQDPPRVAPVRGLICCSHPHRDCESRCTHKQIGFQADWVSCFGHYARVHDPVHRNITSDNQTPQLHGQIQHAIWCVHFPWPRGTVFCVKAV